MKANGWKPPKAVGDIVIVVPDEVATDSEGNQVTESGRYLGSEQHLPMGRVVSVGPEAAKLLTMFDGEKVRPIELGDRLIFQRDLMSELQHDGVKVNFVRASTRCKKCGHKLGNDTIVGVQDDD